jgi:hypothetical protein
MMSRIIRLAWWCCGIVAMASVVSGAGPVKKPNLAVPSKSVDLFAGMESGEIEAVMIMSDATKGVVTVKNKTDQPLTIKMPAALAGLPILAQRRGGGGGVGGMGGMGGRGGMQGMMGGGMMGGMGMGGMGGMGMGGMGMGGMFNIAPEKVEKIKIAAVCIDHGKRDPSPRVPYKPVPAESCAKDPAVVQIVMLMCAGQVDQSAAQAAVWHLQNGLSWEELAQKIGVKHIDGQTEPYFTPAQLDRALAATRIAEQLVEKDANGSSQSR